MLEFSIIIRPHSKGDIEMHWIAVRRTVVSALCIPVLYSCATYPQIDSKSFAPPKSAIIVNIPQMRVAALVGHGDPAYPVFPGFHFSEQADYFFVPGAQSSAGASDLAQVMSSQAVNQIAIMPNPPSPAVAGVAGGVAGALGAILQASAQEANEKARNFNTEFLKHIPGQDLRAEFMKALQAELKSRGVASTLSSDGGNSAPRLRWPAADLKGRAYPSGTSDSFPSVDADVLVQVSPIAFYRAPGSLTSYRRDVTIGIALYNGRTKKFIGKQTIKFAATDSSYMYSNYDDLVKDLPAAAAALRLSLLSLVPQVADIVSARPAR